MRITLLFLLLFPLTVLADDEHKVAVRPNTTTNKITVEIGDQNHASMIQILNDEGTVLWTAHRKEPSFTLNMEFYPPGVYTIQVSVFDQVKNYQFVKKEAAY